MAGPSTLYQTGVHGSRPAASSGCVLYFCTTHSKVYKSDGSAWTDWVTIPTGASVATDTIWDAAGDLAVGTGADTAAKLSIGSTNGMVVQRVSGAVAWALPVGYEFDYATKTSDTSITGTNEAGAQTVISGASVAYDGSTRVEIEVGLPAIVPATTDGAEVVVILLEDSTVLGRIMDHRTSSGTTAILSTPKASLFRTPSNASHTYTVKAYTSTGTSTIKAGTGGTGAYVPAYLRVTKA